MYGIENYLGFLLSGIILNITPGSDTIYILTRSISQGRRAGIYSVLGITTGGLVHTFLAAFGLSIILAKSIIAFNIIKYAGAIYLVYLGIKMLTVKNIPLDNNSINIKKNDLFKIYRQGLLTNLLNPKVALFFLSLLPQFINPHHSEGSLPFLILGFTFMTTGTLWCFLLVYLASFISKTLRNNDKIGRIMQKLNGLIFIIMGVKIFSYK